MLTQDGEQFPLILPAEDVVLALVDARDNVAVCSCNFNPLSQLCGRVVAQPKVLEVTSSVEMIKIGGLFGDRDRFVWSMSIEGGNLHRYWW